MADKAKKILGRDDILQAKDITTKLVGVPEWEGGHVWVASLTGRERDQYEESVMKMKKTGRKGRGLTVLEPQLQGARARLVALACRKDETGAERLFTDADVKALSEKSAAALNRVFDVAAAMSGLSDESVEELLGN